MFDQNDLIFRLNKIACILRADTSKETYIQLYNYYFISYGRKLMGQNKLAIL